MDGVAEPIVAGRTERTILLEMGQDAAAGSKLLDDALAFAERIAEDADKGRVDLTDLGRRARKLLEASAKLRVRAALLIVLSRDFFARSVHDVAPELVGCTLLVDGVGGRIVEVEAYDADDPASHGHRGLTARNRAMFGPPGHAYVYRSYGIHWCLNLVCAEDGRPEAVLVRALEPLALDRMRERRGLDAERLLCSGPGRLCQALGVTGSTTASRSTGCRSSSGPPRRPPT